MRFLSFALTIPEEDNLFLLEEIWRSFDTSNYENLGFVPNSMISIPAILIALCLGIVIASISATFNKKVLGELVRQMIYQGAVGRENAKTLGELGFSGNRTIAQSLRKGVTLRRVVKCAEETEYNEQIAARREEYEQRRKESSGKDLPPFKAEEYRVNTASDRFYIREEDRYAAEVKFDKKGSSWGVVVLTSVVCVVLLVVLIIAMPHILGMLDSFVGSLK